MQPQAITQEISLPDGRIITIETGLLAKQADGSVVVRMGDTMLLATVVSARTKRDGIDFFPLSVDYQEKFASSGRIPGGFLKRESKLSDYEVLISRLVDRALRPMFPSDYLYETQVNISLISAGDNTLPDALAGLAASAAIAASDIPFNGPISECRVAKIDGQLTINPSMKDNERSTLDIMVAGSVDGIVMVEGEMSEISEDEMLEAIEFAHKAIIAQCNAQTEFANKVGKVKRDYEKPEDLSELSKVLNEALYKKVYEFAKNGSNDKAKRSEGFKAILEQYIESLTQEEKDNSEFIGKIKKVYHDIEKDAVRNLIMDERIRLDGRSPEQIRPIWIIPNYLPTTHGSAVFTRGETQSLTTVTLGTKLDEQLIDGAVFAGTSKFMLHYNFPGFSTGEVKPNRAPGRREIGHGNLAFRALKRIMPSGDANPYTVRIVSDILESNGSSSMATVCAGSLALMDAGIKMPEHVSGVAMGLITDTKTGRYAVLTDILGDEDHLGDMDFKVTGTSKGITACQMDLKITGISYEIFRKALAQARDGRLHILGKMNEAISTPRAELKPNAPRFEVVQIDKDLIGALIGPGGKVIQEIQRTTGTTLVIDEREDDAVVSIFATNQTSLGEAMKRVLAIAGTPALNDIYDGKVKAIKPYGGFIEFMPGRDGFLHVSEIAWERVNNVEDYLKIGQEVKVKLIEIDKKNNQYRLSIKALTPKP